MPSTEIILDAIGNTPAVWLDRLTADLPGRVLLKLELANPSGSIKDRAARQCLLDAIGTGVLRPGMTVVELTSGNMGIGLAMACAVLGHPMTAVMSEGNSPERRLLLAAYGAHIELVPQAPGGVPGKVSGDDLALVELRTQQLVEELGAWRPDQFQNPSNPRAHEMGTGPEIWEQAGGRLAAFATLVGTGGTFIGVARALKARDRRVRCLAVEPEGAQTIAGKPTTAPGHVLQGGGYALIPPQWDPALCDGTVAIGDDLAVVTARDLAAREGILAGYSTGGNVAAALQIAATLPLGEAVATIACDSGTRYLSSGLFGDQ
ncbi:MAG: cysteine synthase family protein [Thermomicrobiales bacterium]|nr:cysteine synthase family protein [Thermomicrobiales bacterium]